MAQDVLMIDNGDGGELLLDNNDIKMSSIDSNKIYLSLFGGNTEQDTLDENELNKSNFDWWGNTILDAIKFNSSFERSIDTVVLNSQGRADLIKAAKEDLKDIEEIISVDGAITDLGKFELYVTMTGRTITIEVSRNKIAIR